MIPSVTDQPDKSEARPHDPLCCGLGLGYDCPACAPGPPPLNAHDAAREHWHALCGRYYSLLRDASGPSGRPPAPLDQAELGRLVWTLIDPARRHLLREVLLDLLVDDITDIAQTVAQEVCR